MSEAEEISDGAVCNQCRFASFSSANVNTIRIGVYDPTAVGRPSYFVGVPWHIQRRDSSSYHGCRFLATGDTQLATGDTQQALAEGHAIAVRSPHRRSLVARQIFTQP